MGIYSGFADYYDALTDNVPYQKFADHYERLFKRFSAKPKSILDLACGTGTLSKIFAERGYEVTGVDASEDMLSYALEKTHKMPEPPMFIAQRMEKLDLYGTYDACICALDSVNYITSRTALQAGFVRLHHFIAPGGLFIFDINTQARFEAHDGETLTRSGDGFFCVWQTEYSRKSSLCRYIIDIFDGPDENGKYELTHEEHKERLYSIDALREMLASSGFRVRGIFGGFRLNAPRPDDERIFIVAERI